MKTSSSPITWITEKQITDANGSRLCCLNRNNQVFDDCLAVRVIFVRDWAFGICLLPCVDVFLRDSHSHVSCVWGVAVLCTFFCCGWGTGKAWRASWQPLSDEGAHHMLSYRVKQINVSNYWIQLKTKFLLILRLVFCHDERTGMFLLNLTSCSKWYRFLTAVDHMKAVTLKFIIEPNALENHV